MNIAPPDCSRIGYQKLISSGFSPGIRLHHHASGPCPPHGRRAISGFGNQRATPQKFLHKTETVAISRSEPQRGQQRHPCNSRTQSGGVAASEAGARLFSQRDSAARLSVSAPVARPARREARVPCGLAKKHRALGSAKRGKECDLKTFRSSRSCASDRHRMSLAQDAAR